MMHAVSADQAAGPRRISVVGNTGSGKSTTARRFAEVLGLERLELDAIRHQAHWRELPDDEFREHVLAFMRDNEAWVIDGNYPVIQPQIWGRADTVVWLDPPLARNVWNVVERTVRRLLLRETLWNENRERWRNLMSLDPETSVVAWAWAHHASYRERYSSAAVDPEWDDLKFVRAHSPEDVERWLGQVAAISPR
jgi:adenylate kinase family enzyme